jgi:hypothetical protein
MVVALLIWAVWVTKKNTAVSTQVSAEIPCLVAVIEIKNPAGFRFYGYSGISLCTNRTARAAVCVKKVRYWPKAAIFKDLINTDDMKKALLLLLVAISAHGLLQAQTTEDSVKAAVNQLFEGMKTANAGLVRTAFADSAILQTIITRNKEGKTVIRNEAVSGFAEFVGKEQSGAADERIQFETIKIDGPLAIVWTPYKFYFNGNFSHCGVNSFQLVRLNGQWKIQYLIDTRRKDKCE